MKFGTSGIREIYSEKITGDIIKLGNSISRLGVKSVFIANDTRKSCSLIADYLGASISMNGIDVELGGELPTPVIAFVLKKREFDLGVSSTASHNPPEFCGVKLFDENGIALNVDVEKKIEENLNVKSLGSGNFDYGNISYDCNARDDYFEDIFSCVGEQKKKFRMVVDCANGVGSDFTPRLLGEMGHSVLSINANKSHNFFGRMPEPNAENLVHTANLVKEFDVDFGIAHDGDADRLVLINKDGVVLDDYMMSYLLLKIILEEGRRGDVVISINTSDSIESLAKENGCNVTRTRLGKTFNLLKERNGIFATEPSKIVDSRWGYWEDGIYAIVKLVDYMSRNNFSLEDLVKEIPKKSYLQRNIVMKEFDMGKVKERAMKSFDVKEVEEIDGLRLLLDDAWVLFRASGTEPKCRIYVESDSKERSSEIMSKASIILEEN